MSADVVQFPVQTGNGAREALERYWRGACYKQNALQPWDHMLAWLWAEGFKIVPLDGGVDPAA